MTKPPPHDPAQPCRGDVGFAQQMAVHRHFTLPLWEHRLSSQILTEHKERMGPREWARGFQQRAINEADLLWKPAVLELAKDLTQTCTSVQDPNGWLGSAAKYMGVDLAIARAKSAESAFFVITVVAVDAGGRRWVIACDRRRHLTFNQQCDAIIATYQRYGPVLIKVESNGYQQSIIDHLGLTTTLPIKSVYTGAAQHRDVEVGMPGMAAEWEQEKWRVPFGDSASREYFAPLFEELGSYPNGMYQDTVMALFFAREGFRQPGANPRILVLS